MIGFTFWRDRAEWTAPPPAPPFVPSVREAYPGILDHLPSPRGFDATVFGDWTPGPADAAPMGWDKRTCPECDVTWHGPAPCWFCGRPAEPP